MCTHTCIIYIQNNKDFNKYWSSIGKQVEYLQFQRSETKTKTPQLEQQSAVQ